MKHMTDTHNDPCAGFLDNLDMWLAGELAADRSMVMQAHHDACAACRHETRLAREIDAITEALPDQVCPEFQLPAINKSGISRARPGQPVSQHVARTDPPLISRLLAVWRRPLVLVPAFVLVLSTLLVIQLGEPDAPGDPQIVIIDGQEYTRDEIVRATEDLEIALHYLDKYGSYPARVVQSELEQSHLPLPAPRDSRNNSSI